MSNFKSFGTPAVQKTVVRFFLNISKKAGPKATILGYTHNGIVFASEKNDSSWIQFRAISDKQGATPIELFHEGQVYTIDPEKFWTGMFSCSPSEMPDVKLKANIGDITAGEELIEAGGCLVIEADVEGLRLSEGEYKGEPIVYFNLKVEKMYLTETRGTTVDAEWVMTNLGNAVVNSAYGKDKLSRFRRVSKLAPAQQMAEEVKADNFDFENLVDL